jgi:putative sugar O-methyltransferase
MKRIIQLAIQSQRIKVLMFSIDFALRSYVQNRLLLAWCRIQKLPLLRVRLIRGWRTQTDTDLGLVYQNQDDLLISGQSPKFRNSRIDGTSTLNILVRSKTPVAYPFEVVAPFVTSTEDGNFNFLAKTSTDVNLETFRTNPAYHYLDPGHRAHLKEIEHWERLLEMGISSLEIEKDLETLASLSEVDTKLDDGLVRRMDVIHYFFLRQIARHHSRERQIRVVEIGGGYGGLARQAFRLKHVSISEYTIIDIPITLALIERYLERELSPAEFDKVTFIDGTENGFETRLPAAFDLGVATHSLSELDPEVVNTYMTHVIPRCETFLLSMQRKFHLNNLDYDWLYRRFLDRYTQEQLVITEGSNVLNAFLKSRSRKTRT